MEGPFGCWMAKSTFFLNGWATIVEPPPVAGILE